MAEMKSIALDDIRVNPDAIRVVNRKTESYLGLVESIKAKGFTSVIAVRQVEEDGNKFYVVMDGMHRYMAAQDAGLTEVPCLIRDFDDAEAIEVSIMNNVHGKETSPSEYRKGLLMLLNRNPLMTEGDLAVKLGMSTAWVASRLSLNKIESDEIMALIDSGEINLSNAYALAKLPADEQLQFITDAQTLPPIEFVPKVAERAKEIKDAKRKGEDPSKADFRPSEYMQKMGDIKAQRDSGEIADALIAETGVTTAKDGFILALNYVLHADAISIAEQKTKWDAKEAAKAEKARQRTAELAAKKKEKIQADLDKAAAAEVAAKEAAGL